MPAKKKKATRRISVHCAYDELVPIQKVKPHPQNPNRHPDNQIQLLAKIILEQGWRAAITVSCRSGYIVRGHGRLSAAHLLNEKTVPVDYQEYPDENSELADLIADNRIAELSALDIDSVQVILDQMDVDYDHDLTGYDDNDMVTLFDVGLPQLPRHVDEVPPSRCKYFLISVKVDAVPKLAELLAKIRSVRGVHMDESKNGQ